MRAIVPDLFAECVALALLAWLPEAQTWAAQISGVKVAQLPAAQQFIDLRIQGNYLYTTGNGFQIFDISNRTNPVNVATSGLSYGGGNLSVSGNYAYVLDGNSQYAGTLHVFDVSTPTNPTQVTQFSGGYCISVFGQYAFLDSTIYDISDPANPVELGHLPGVGPVGGWTGNFVSVAGNYAYVAQNFTGLVVFDISDPTHPVQVGQASSGMYAWEVALNGNYAYVAAATNCGLAAFNISNPTNPVALPCWAPGDQRVALSGNFAFLDWGGLGILDISNPTNMSVAAEVDPYTYALRVAVTGNYAYVAGSDYQTGQSSLEAYRLDVSSPPLGISTTQTNSVVLTWPAPTITFAVQQNHDLNSNNWVTLTNTPDLVASMNQIVLPVPPQNTFYRLTVSGP